VEKIVIGLYGAGGFGKEVMSLLPSILPKLFPGTNHDEIRLCFIDDDLSLSSILDKEVISLTKFLESNQYELYYGITIADPTTRKLIASKLKNTSAKPIKLIFDNSLILSHSHIGTGAIIMPGTTISTSVNIGSFSHINFNSYIAHDCRIGDFVTISPHGTCCGNTDVKDGAFIGAGSVIKQGTIGQPRYVGLNSKLGMGSNLLTDLPDNKTFAGNPAIDLKI
jgi:sugar O-acyltransferase (sialic acid O-acetyltransferase NeuD family)